MSVPSAEFASNNIPKKMHFIWIGSPLPEEYLNNIIHYASLARKGGFEINLWTDKFSQGEKFKLLETKNVKLKIRILAELKKSNDEDMSPPVSAKLSPLS